MNKSNNIAYIMQPHYLSNCFRVSCDKQLGRNNYIIVTCSPSFNGVYTYDKSILKDCKLWSNKGRMCYEIPVNQCTLYKRLEELQNPEIIKEIKKQQSNWVKTYKQKPDWLI